MKRFQSILVPRSTFKTLQAAKKEVKKLGFRVKKVDITDRYYRFRQFDPKVGHTYRTIKFGRVRAIYRIK